MSDLHRFQVTDDFWNKVMENPIVLVMVITTYVFSAIGLVIAQYKDKKDKELVGNGVKASNFYQNILMHCCSYFL